MKALGLIQKTLSATIVALWAASMVAALAPLERLLD